MVVLNLIALFSSLLFHGASATVDIESLLWPMPATVDKVMEGCMMLNPDNFQFVYSIHTAKSDILDKAFERYMDIIFQSPVPFYPDGAGPNVDKEMKTLTIRVLHPDETLNQATHDSCK